MIVWAKNLFYLNRLANYVVVFNYFEYDGPIECNYDAVSIVAQFL